MKYFSLCWLFLTSFVLSAQVGIGTDNPHASSILDIESTNAGILIPRVSLTNTTSTTPITAPAVSLLVYNTATSGDIVPGFYYWTGTEWQRLSESSGGNTGSQGWGLRGNIVTDDDFIGTLQNYKPLRFRVNGTEFANFHPGGGITLGYGASAFNDNAIAIGSSSIAGTSNSIAIGTNASTSISNLSIAIGNNAEVTEHESIAIGNSANASQNSSLAVGVLSSASGINATALGKESNATAINSTAIGYGATVSQPNTIRLGNDDVSVGIGTSTMNISTILEINSPNKGILIPRVSLTNQTARDVVTNPVESMLIYNTNTNTDISPGFYYWSGTQWQSLSGSSGNKSYGERHYTSDYTIQLSQWNNINAPAGVVNSLTTSDINTSAHGLTMGAEGGTYKVTLTITYAKETATAEEHEVEFFITHHTNRVANTTIRADLNNNLKRNTVTLTKIMTLEPWGTYHFGIRSIGVGSPSIILYSNLTNMVIERID